MPTTTPINAWPVPVSTDLVKDGAEAIEDLGDAIDASVGSGLLAWQSYVPVWGSTGTAPALVNGTITGKYCQIGKTVHFIISMTTGSSTTYGSGTRYTWSLPVNNENASVVSCSGYVLDSSTSQYYIVPTARLSATVIDAAFFGLGPTGLTGTVVGFGEPVTSGAGDFYMFNGTYEAV